MNQTTLQERGGAMSTKAEPHGCFMGLANIRVDLQRVIALATEIRDLLAQIVNHLNRGER